MTDTDWPYDAKQDDPLTALRIPVVGTIHPRHYYLVALCINENPETMLWHGLRPNDREVTLIRSFIDYERSRYNPGWVQRHFDPKPLDVDGGHNTITLIKRGDNDWAYRRSTWTRGPSLIPFTLEGHPETQPPLDLPGLLDRIEWMVDAPFHAWVEWKTAHPDVFPEATV